MHVRLPFTLQSGILAASRAIDVAREKGTGLHCSLIAQRATSILSYSVSSSANPVLEPHTQPASAPPDTA